MQVILFSFIKRATILGLLYLILKIISKQILDTLFLLKKVFGFDYFCHFKKIILKENISCN